jgi:predicted DNA-binding ribbon-helix-helix protein
VILRPELPYQKLKRTVHLSGHKTKVSLEFGFWSALKEIAAHEEISVSLLVIRIDADGEHANLSSAVRLFVLDPLHDISQTEDRQMTDTRTALKARAKAVFHEVARAVAQRRDPVRPHLWLLS